MSDPKNVPLAAMHEAVGARMGPFAGWNMPIQYPGGLKAEHLHTREAASLFDVSHMGQLRVTAADGRPSTLHTQLEAALPVDFDNWPSGQQKYSFLLNDNGGIEDDLMLVHLHDGLNAEVRLITNAGNREADLRWLEAQCPQLRFEWIDAALVALQGPQAEQVLAALDPAAAALRFMQATTLKLLGADCFATRSGYTGEDGYEISLPLEHAQVICARLIGRDEVRWAGLGARDTLRLEAGLALHGNDIGPTVTVVEAGLAFAIPKSRRAGGTKAGGFPGAETILRQLAEGPQRRLVGLVSHGAIPIRAHTALVGPDDARVGEVTSGTVSPSLGHPVMLALVERRAIEHAATEPLHAMVRDKRPPVQITPLPFVPKRYKR
ncbi:MAG: glycine cleavage system aminomethyltransferase GcvT [Burkholderiaceae bacterium]